MTFLLKKMDLLALAGLGGGGLRSNTLHAAHIAAFGNLASVLGCDSTLNAGDNSGSGGIA